jgi:hypothetical protein
MGMFFSGPASTYTSGGNITAASSTLFEWGNTQRLLVVQNRTGGNLLLRFGEDSSTGQEAESLFIADGETFISTRVEFKKVAIYAASTATLTGASKNFSVAAWSTLGSA